MGDECTEKEFLAKVKKFKVGQKSLSKQIDAIEGEMEKQQNKLERARDKIEELLEDRRTEVLTAFSYYLTPRTGEKFSGEVYFDGDHYVAHPLQLEQMYDDGTGDYITIKDDYLEYFDSFQDAKQYVENCLVMLNQTGTLS